MWSGSATRSSIRCCARSRSANSVAAALAYVWRTPSKTKTGSLSWSSTRASNVASRFMAVWEENASGLRGPGGPARIRARDAGFLVRSDFARDHRALGRSRVVLDDATTEPRPERRRVDGWRIDRRARGVHVVMRD